MAEAVKFANTVEDFAGISSFSGTIARLKDRTDGAKGPGNTGAIGSFMLVLRDWAQGGGVRWPVVNKTGGALAVNRLVEITGYDEATGRFKIGLADNSTSALAWGVLPAGLADGAVGEAYVDVLLPSSGLDTSGVGVTKGDPVYLGTAGAFTLTAPATTAIQTLRQVVGFVETKAVSGTVRLKAQAPRWQGADVKAYVDGLVGAVPNWGAPVADVAALKLVAAADRADKQTRVVESDATGNRSGYVFDSTAGDAADDDAIVAPGAGTGRWFKAFDANSEELLVVNNTAGVLVKGTAVAVVGLDAGTGRWKIDKADNSNAAKRAAGVLQADLAALTGVTTLLSDYVLATSGLDTTAAVVGDPVFYNNVGALVLAKPSTAAAYAHEVARVQTLAVSGTLRVHVLPAPEKIGTESLQDQGVTYAKIQNVSATDKLLGRMTAAAGVVEEIPLTAAGRSLVAQAAGSIDDVQYWSGLAVAARLAMAPQTVAVKAAAGLVAQVVGAGEFVGRPVAGNLGVMTAAQARAAVQATTELLFDELCAAGVVDGDRLKIGGLTQANLSAALAVDAIDPATEILKWKALSVTAAVWEKVAAAGALSATVAGRASVATGFFDAATAADKVAAGALPASKLEAGAAAAGIDGGDVKFSVAQAAGVLTPPLPTVPVCFRLSVPDAVSGNNDFTGLVGKYQVVDFEVRTLAAGDVGNTYQLQTGAAVAVTDAVAPGVASGSRKSCANVTAGAPSIFVDAATVRVAHVKVAGSTLAECTLWLVPVA